MDAIKNSEFAIVVYPGDESKFYEKDINKPVRKKLNQKLMILELIVLI